MGGTSPETEGSAVWREGATPSCRPRRGPCTQKPELTAPAGAQTPTTGPCHWLRTACPPTQGWPTSPRAGPAWENVAVPSKECAPPPNPSLLSAPSALGASPTALATCCSPSSSRLTPGCAPALEGRGGCRGARAPEDSTG